MEVRHKSNFDQPLPFTGDDTIDSCICFRVTFRMFAFKEIGKLCVSVVSSADIWFVKFCVRSTRRTAIRRSAITASWLGNGWIYLGIGLACVCTMGTRGILAIIASAICVGVLHCLYRPTKRWFSRPRPFHSLPDLKPLLPVLDEHSFPSGHAMTLTAVLVSLPLAFPEIIFGYITLWIIMAWARIAVAHHYPSDVLAGSVLAALVSYPLSKLSYELLHLVFVK
jgi:undecaprenyl-diphosphatase